MAWPATPIATFVNGSAPPVDDTFLNTLQAGVNGLCVGTATHSGIVIDGLGGAVASPVAGALVVQPASLSTAPQAVFRDQLGNVRGIYDHNGYRRGRIREVVFDWTEFVGGPLVGAVSSSGALGRVQYTVPASATLSFSSITYPGSQALLFGNLGAPIANAQQYRVSTAPLFAPQTYSSLVMEFEVGYASTGWDMRVGLIGGAGTSSATPGVAETSFCIVKQNTDTNYFLCMNNGIGSPSKYDTTVAPSAAPALDRFTIEWHGSASPFGARQRVFINEVLRIDSNQAGVPTGVNVVLGFVAGMTTVSGTNTTSMSVSPVRITWNSALSIPTI